jgi:hypothetical protein
VSLLLSSRVFVVVVVWPSVGCNRLYDLSLSLSLSLYLSLSLCLSLSLALSLCLSTEQCADKQRADHLKNNTHPVVRRNKNLVCYFNINFFLGQLVLIDDDDELKTVSAGAFGKVMCATRYAVKKLHNSSSSIANEVKYWKLVRLTKNVSHVNDLFE